MSQFPTPLSLDDALRVVRDVAALHVLEPERLRISRCHGRVLGADLFAASHASSVPNGALASGQCAGLDSAGPMLAAGQVMTPSRVALAASLGIADAQVRRRPTVAVFTSGDRLVEPGLALAAGQVHDGVRDLLMGLLRADGLEPTAWPALPDDPRRVEIALRDAACAFDLVLTCAPTGEGERDHVPAVLAEEARMGRGCVHFSGVRMRPGGSVRFASVDQARVLSMAGDPLSVLGTYLTLGRALVDGLQARSEARVPWHAELAAGLTKLGGEAGFMPGRLASGIDAKLQVAVEPADGAQARATFGDLKNADALVMLREGPLALEAGAVVEVLPFQGQRL